MAAALIYSYMRLTVLNDQISQVRTELTEVSNEGVLLKTQYESRYDLTQIEDYAVKELGMTKMDRSQVEYVEIGNPDTIVRSGSGTTSSWATVQNDRWPPPCTTTRSPARRPSTPSPTCATTPLPA